jgi:hypothetical protein
MLLLGFLIAALVMTSVMFAKKEPMLGFPSAIFWMLTGAQAFTLSTNPWRDLYFYLFFVCSVGMTIFTMFAAYGLREKHDAIGEEEDEDGVTEYEQDSEKRNTNKSSGSNEDRGHGTDHEDPFSGESSRPSLRTQKLRERARERRTGG